MFKFIYSLIFFLFKNVSLLGKGDFETLFWKILKIFLLCHKKKGFSRWRNLTLTRGIIHTFEKSFQSYRINHLDGGMKFLKARTI